VARYYKAVQLSKDGEAPKIKAYSIKPEKTKDPAPGSYNVEESIVKT